VTVGREASPVPEAEGTLHLPTAGPRPAERGYDAFISYSHEADGTLAPAIQHGLQTLAKPLAQRRVLRVFRDQTSLAVTPALWPSIEEALKASRYFILLASPAAADSPWVQKELGWWMEHREPGTLLIVLTAGTILWDRARGDFAWPASDALPTTLSGWFNEEPLWVDLRWTRKAPRLSHRDPQLHDDLATLAAPLRGVPKDELVGLDLVLHRRAVRLRRLATVLLAVLALGAAGGALVAVDQRNTAQEQTLTATSRQLVAEAATIQDSQPNLARQLLAQAYRLARTDQTIGALLGSSSIPRVIPTRGTTLSLAYSPHRELLAVASDESVTLYDARNGRALATLPVEESVGAIAFSQDDRLLAAGDNAGGIRLWDVTTARRPALLHAVDTSAGAIQAVAFGQAASLLTFVAERPAVGVLDIGRRDEPRMLTAAPEGATAGLRDAVAVSPDGRLVLADGGNGTIRLWDLSRPGRSVPRGTLRGPAGSVTFSPDSQLLAIATEVTRLWDVGDPARPKDRGILAGQSLGIGAVAFSADGSTLATGAGDRTIQLWDVTDPIRPTQGARLTGHTDSIDALAFSGDGHTLASASADGAATDEHGLKADRTVRLWSVIGSGRSTAVSRLESAGATLPSFTPDSRTMAAGFPMTLWDLGDRTSLRALATVPTFAQGQPAVGFSADGRTLASGLPVVLWDVSDRARPRLLTPGTAVTDRAEMVSFSPTDPVLAIGTLSDEVQLWDVRRPGRPNRIATLPSSRSARQGVAFRRDGRILAALEADGGVQLWDVAQPSAPQRRGRINPGDKTVEAVAFSSDGGRLLTGGSAGLVASWDVADPSDVRELGSVAQHTGSVEGLAYQPGGAIAARASDDGSIRLWNMAAPTDPVAMTVLSAGGAYDSAVLAFSPDGRTLAASSASDLQLWSVDVPGILQRLCAESPRITPAQWAEYLPDQPYDPPCA
jgi:WD40 repeat protein